MSKGFAQLAAAHDFREALRLGDQDASREVRAVILTTHDCDLRFVLAELLPGYLQDPGAVPAGFGPAHRSYRQAMLDLPPTSIVYAPEASVSLDVPWRPPTLELVPYHEPRRQHAKVAAILFALPDGRLVLRLVAGSANLTRRAFSNNLEIAAFADYELGGRQHPALFELRRLLEYIGAATRLRDTRAYQIILDELPQSRGRAEAGDAEFVHSVEPKTLSQAIARWVGEPPSGKHAQETLIASPFFPAEGKRLHAYCRDSLRWPTEDRRRIALILDGRGISPTGAQNARSPDEPWSTPPPWFDALRAPDSPTYVPALLAKKRGQQEDQPFRGTGQRGRSLHAKLIATWFAREADGKGGIVRLFVGSANFTEAGLGLLGERSNVEAGFLIEQESRHAAGLQRGHVNESLCFEHAFDPPRERPVVDEPDLEAIFAATGRSKRVVAALEREGVCTIEERKAGYDIVVRLPNGLALDAEVWFGKIQLARDAEGVLRCTTETLAPFHLRVVVDGITTYWPFPVTDEQVRLSLVAAAGAKRRVDRLLDFWLTSSTAPAELVDEDADGLAAVAAGAIDQAHEQIGSWRLNRLMLGVRRRLAETVARVGPSRLPSAANLLHSIRIRELLELVAGLPKPDALYLGMQVRAMLRGYRAAEIGRNRSSVAALDNDKVVLEWEATDVWQAFAEHLEDAQEPFARDAQAILESSAEALFLSVRDGEVVR